MLMVRLRRVHGNQRKMHGGSLESLKVHNEIEDDSAAAGGVVRNRNREWIYNKFLGSCSVFKAELWGILDGLNMLIDRGLGNVMIQSDSLEVVMVIQESSTGGAENQEADSLAKLAHSGSQGLRMFGKPSFGELG
ncbi:hypothetical protein Golob_007595 [Gossypium lobatum]|uniref:RNase H type-1 domain-containing protein n=2 Tax=Gossypium TaxID=3633 RepID=A0A7J8MD86_9ROSI|nr:hypothetical protein [Gossypium lobatum]